MKRDNPWDSAAAYWDQYMGEFGDWFNQSVLHPAVLTVLKSHLKTLTGRRMLDAGCGTGSLARLLARQGVEVLGVDSSLEMLRHARLWNTTHGYTIRYETHDLTLTPIRARKKFDATICHLVIQDVEQASSVIRNLKQSLRPEGVLVVSTRHPATNSLDDDLGWLYSSHQGAGALKTAGGLGLTGIGIHGLKLTAFRGFLMDRYFPDGGVDEHHRVWKTETGEVRTSTFRRPLETYVRMMTSAGFVIIDLVEPRPSVTPALQAMILDNLLHRMPWFVILVGRIAELPRGED